MITVADKVELKATVTALGTGTFDISISEIYVDTKWESFTTPKALTITTTDYSSSVITQTEKDLTKALLQKYSSGLTGDDAVAAASLLAKLA